MFKLIVLTALVAVAHGGIIGSPLIGAPSVTRTVITAPVGLPLVNSGIATKIISPIGVGLGGLGGYGVSPLGVGYGARSIVTSSGLGLGAGVGLNGIGLGVNGVGLNGVGINGLGGLGGVRVLGGYGGLGGVY